jgi:integrase
MRQKLPYLLREKTRHGKYVWYFRVQHGPRLRLPGDYGSDEFMAAYRAALAGEPVVEKGKADPRTLQWLFEQWMRSSDWAQTANSTRRQRENVLSRIIAENPTAPFRAITADHIRAGRERRKSTPAAANNFIKTMRALFAWAEEAKHVEANPAKDVKFIANKTDGFIPWTMEDLARFRACWPLGTRERVAIEVLANTGLRRGDAVRLGRQHVKEGVAVIRAEKTGVELFIPILPALTEALAHGPTGDLSFICGADGRPLVKESFGNFFRKACSKARVPGSAHGVRKLAATVMADEGATEEQLKALFGWQTNDQSLVYTRTANRRRLAIEAAGKLARGTQTRCGIDPKKAQ